MTSLPEVLGYAAAILLIASFAMKSIMLLRYLAIGASVALAVYAVLVEHWLLLAIAVILAAVNAWRIMEIRRLFSSVRDVTTAAAAPVDVDWLLPYMRPVDVPKDHVLFSRGDIAQAIYFISAGRIRFEELGIEIGKGTLFGEIGVFSVNQIRTGTARCLEPCSLLLISAEKVRELYYENPEFGFYLVGLIISRLMEDAEMARHMKP